jgi:prephenate dehydrogenase
MAGRIFDTVAIVGPGLIGGSIGMGLKQNGLAAKVVGIGHRQSSIDKAIELRAIDEGTLDIAKGVAGADLVILCAGVAFVPEQAARAIPAMKPGGILTDVGSTKCDITEKIEAMIGNSDLGFIGTHPLAGLEKRGVEAARGDLFRGSICIFTPTAHTTPEAKERLNAMWSALGARVRELDATTHDRLISEISHLPHLIAAALVNSASLEALEFAASGFRDTTRIAGGDPELWAEILLENRENVARGMISMLEQIGVFAGALDKGDNAALQQILRAAKERRDKLGNNVQQ